jgi:hypothetical protein
MPRPGRFSPGNETRYPLNRGLGGLQGQFEPLRYKSSPPGFDPCTAQPVTNRYTDYTIPTHDNCNKYLLNAKSGYASLRTNT